MAELVVEVHVPLTPMAGQAEDDYPFPWIDDVEEFLESLEPGGGQEYDSGEELGDEYVFFLGSAPEPDLVRLAARIANLPGVPAGVYVVVNDARGDMGAGRRVDIAD
jgi:hypothetical protein